MKKFVLYLVIATIIIGGLTYALGEQGLLGGLLGTLGVGGNEALKKLKAQGAELDKQAEEKKSQLADTEKEKENLEVKDLTPEEEEEYWKNQ
jgi:hypothetical protein